MKKCLSFLAMTLLLLCLLPMQVFAAETMPIEDFQAAVAEAVASGNDLVLDKTVAIQQNLDLNLGSSKLIISNGAQIGVAQGFTLRITGCVVVQHGEINVNPGATLDITPGSRVFVGTAGLILDGNRYEASDSAFISVAGTLNCGGQIDIIPNGCLWIPDGGVANIDNYLYNMGVVHVGVGSGGSMNLRGTLQTVGYLAVHENGTLAAEPGSKLEILHREGRGYLDNQGTFRLGGTMNVDGIFTTGKNKETGEGIGVTELWGGNIYASKDSEMAVLTGGSLAVNGIANNQVVGSVIESAGELKVEKEAALFVHNSSTLSAEGTLINEGYLHVGMDGEGTLDLYGTADVTGYLCIHPAGKFQVHDDSTLNILNNETGCGYLDNKGFVIMGKNAVNLDGLLTTGKDEETKEGNGTLELRGTTITATEKSQLGVGYQGNLAMNDATITSSGEIRVEKEGALWVHSNSALTTSGTLTSLGNIHVGMDGKGTLNLNGTATTSGYLAVHADGTLNLAKKATLHILNNENGCGYLDNKGIVKLNGTLTVDGLFTSEIAEPVIKATNKASNGKPQLAWKSVDNATKYEIYRSTSKTGTYKKLYTQKSTTYTNTAAEAGKQYYYKVKAIDGYGNTSGYSNRVSRTCDLAQPTNVKATNVASSGKIKLTWTKVAGAKSYKVYRATSKTGTYTLMKTVTGTTYTNSSAKAGKTYYYKIIAVHENTNANSAYSAIVSRMCDLARPVVSISRTSAGKPKLTWKAVDGAVKYQVYRSTTGKDGSFKLLKTVTKTSFTNTGATAGRTYYYKVKAIHSNTSANSAFSTVKNIKAK